jgi:hypothetical protein
MKMMTLEQIVAACPDLRWKIERQTLYLYWGEFLSSYDPDNSDLLKAALEYAAHGSRIFPCSPANKKPFTTNGFKDATTDATSIRKFWRQHPTAMIGVACGEKSGVWCLDPDAPTDKNPMDGRESLRALQAEHGALPPTHTHLTPGGGNHLIFKWRGDRAPITNREGALTGKHINVRGEGGYFIAAGSVNADGIAYTMADSALYFQIAPAPDWLHDLIDAKPVEAELPISQRALDAMGGQRFVNTGNANSTGKGYAKAALVKECAKLAGIAIDRNNELNNSAIGLGGLVKAGELTEAEVVAGLIKASVANGLDNDDGRRATLATIASGMGAAVVRVIPLKARNNNVALVAEEPSAGDGIDDDDSEPPAVSETEFALADDFIAAHKDDLRYFAKFGKWQLWHGTGWKEDATVRVFDLARRICRRAAANKDKAVAKAISKARTVAAVETLARSYPSVAATVDQWDTHPTKFNVSSGTIDLTTGNVLPHNRLDYITKNAACSTRRNRASDLVRFFEDHHGGRRRSDRLPATLHGLLPDRADQRTPLCLRSWWRRQRQGHPHQHPHQHLREYLRRLRHHFQHRDLHGIAQRTAHHGNRQAARRAAGRGARG